MKGSSLLLTLVEEWTLWLPPFQKQFAKVRAEFFNSGEPRRHLANHTSPDELCDGGNAPLIAQKVADRFHSQKQPGLL